MTSGPKPIPIADRFWTKVAKRGPNECWEWCASLSNKGYGKIGRNGGGGHVPAHRVSWELSNGPIPNVQCVLHRCDNPPCVNPAHLFLGTKADNTADMISKGRNVPPRGEMSGRAKLTNDAVIDIRSRHANGERQVDLAHEYNLNDGTISRIISGKRWAHLP